MTNISKTIVPVLLTAVVGFAVACSRASSSPETSKVSVVVEDGDVVVTNDSPTSGVLLLYGDPADDRDPIAGPSRVQVVSDREFRLPAERAGSFRLFELVPVDCQICEKCRPVAGCVCGTPRCEAVILGARSEATH